MTHAQISQRLPVIACIIAALMLAIVPMPNWASLFRPDWLALTLIYWAMMLPRTYSVGTAWIVGIVLDVAQAFYQFVLFWINGGAGINAPAVTYWGPVVMDALIWPLLALFFTSVYYRVK